jgi:cell wall-associated NlpC family hydrolase
MFRLHSCIGMPYLWGGNHKGTTQRFTEMFQYKGTEVRQQRALRLDGIDCSGLLFYATNYQTPRNTSQLQNAGIAILNGDVKPLDLILTKGHVRIILDHGLVLQSRQNRGVYLTSLDKELYLLNKHKKRVGTAQFDQEYSVRRILSICG